MIKNSFLVHREYPSREQTPAMWGFGDEYKDNRTESDKQFDMPVWERPCRLNDILNKRKVIL